MSETDYERIRSAWQNATPGDIVRALNHLDEYAPDVAGIIRDEAEQRGLSAHSTEAYPAPIYGAAFSIGRAAATRIAERLLPLRKAVKHHPYISAVLLGVMYYFVGTYLPYLNRIPFVWLGIYYVMLTAICLPLRRYRLAVLVPLTAGFTALAVMSAISIPQLADLGPPFPLKPVTLGILIGFAGCSALPAIILSIVVYFRNRYWPVHEPGRCRVCDYDLRGLPQPRCPECGTPFDPAELLPACPNQPTDSSVD